MILQPMSRYAGKMSKTDLDTERKLLNGSTHNTGSSCKLVNEWLISDSLTFLCYFVRGGPEGGLCSKVNKKLKYTPKNKQNRFR